MAGEIIAVGKGNKEALPELFCPGSKNRRKGAGIFYGQYSEYAHDHAEHMLRLPVILPAWCINEGLTALEAVRPCPCGGLYRGSAKAVGPLLR